MLLQYVFRVPDDLSYAMRYQRSDLQILRTFARLDTTIAGQMESMKHCRNKIITKYDERLFASNHADVRARVLSRDALLPVARCLIQRHHPLSYRFVTRC